MPPAGVKEKLILSAGLLTAHSLQGMKKDLQVSPPQAVGDVTKASPTTSSNNKKYILLVREQLDDAKKEAAKRKEESKEFKKAPAKKIQCQLEPAQQTILDQNKKLLLLNDDLQKMMLSTKKIHEAKDIYKQKDHNWEKERRSQLESELKMAQHLNEITRAARDI